MTKHKHGWRWDLSVMWREECDTCTDYCQQDDQTDDEE